HRVSVGLSLLVVAGVMLVVVYLLFKSRSFFRCIHDLKKEAYQITNGFINQNITVNRVDEIGDLQEAIAQTREYLVKTLRSAMASSNAKSEFLAMMSHEIRTPLNGVIGMAEALQEEEGFDQEQRDMINTIADSGEFLLAIVNDILDYSKIETGKMKLDHIEFDLFRLIRSITKVFQLKAKDKNLVFELNIDDNIGQNVKGDPNRIRQIITNLLGNAMKFTDQGKVSLILKLESDEEEQQVIRVEVKDTGIGITEEKINVIFESFSQADTSTTRKYGGTGLGLSISVKLAELMRSRLEVDSQYGKGSVFSFSLALEKQNLTAESKAPEQEKTEYSEKALEGNKDIQVLVVEDNMVNQKVIVKLLKKMNYSVDVANNGEIGVEAAKNKLYNIILMDIQMPVMGGLEATAWIRKHEKETGQFSPIVALTADVVSMGEGHGVREKYVEAGMNEYISKPVKKDILYRIIKELTSKEKAKDSADPEILESAN
ncbi:MAG: response regulator, partial [Planctomycetes bacterium]|nr:response regulator [Planctomycetota bacterium]